MQTKTHPYDLKQLFESAMQRLSTQNSQRVDLQTPIYRRTQDSEREALADAAKALVALWNTR